MSCACVVALQLMIRVIYKLLMAHPSENKRENDNKKIPMKYIENQTVFFCKLFSVLYELSC